jgi:hypothetical protein
MQTYEKLLSHTGYGCGLCKPTRNVSIGDVGILIGSNMRDASMYLLCQPRQHPFPIPFVGFLTYLIYIGRIRDEYSPIRRSIRVYLDSLRTTSFGS